MNVRQLEWAVMLSQERNISQTAQKLGVTQPALSKQILSLEKELGVKLFDRNHVPMTLTPAGEYFIQKAKAMLYDQEQLQRAMEQFRQGCTGRLDIGVTPFRSMYLMPGIVARIRQRYPGIRVVLHEEKSAQLRKDVAQGKYDFAVINLPADESLVQVRPLEPDRLMLAVPDGLMDRLPASARQGVKFAECAELPFVVLGPGQEMRQLFEKLCARAGIRPDIAAQVVGITTAWALAREGVGAALLPYQFAHLGSFREKLNLIPILDNVYTRQPAVAYRRGQYLPEYAVYAMELTQKLCKGEK